MKEVLVPSGFKRIIGAWNTEYQGRLVEYDGYRWQVGVEDGEYPVVLEDLIYYYPLAVKYLNLEDKEIAVSLPAEAFLKDKELVEVLKEKLRKETGNQASVYPQGIIALAGLELKDKENILVIDGGFNTLNTAVVDMTDDGIKVKWLRTYYNEFGVRDLLEKYFREELLRKFPEVPNNFQTLSKIFTKGYVDTGFKRVEVVSERDMSLRVFFDSLLRRLRGDIVRSGKEVEVIVIVGGLGYYFREVELETQKKVIIPSKVEFANARGMHKASGLPSVDFGFGQIKAVLDKK